MAIQTIIMPGAQNLSFGVPGGTQVSPILVAAGSAAARAVVNRLTGGGGDGKGLFERGADIRITSGVDGACDPQCPPGFSWSQAKGCCVKTRRRRRRMLTNGDKCDIAFLTATLGKGEMAKAAIGSLLAGGCR